MSAPHQTRRPVSFLLVAVVAAGVVLAACSSSSSSPTTSASPATTRATSSTTTRPTTPTTSTTVAGLARCATTALTGSVTGSGGAAGTIETTIGLKSTSATTCILGGYPGLQLLDSAGANLPTVVVRKGNYNFTSMVPTTVTLTNGQSAYFNLGYSDVPVGTEACPTSTSLLITPPNATDSLRMTAMLAPCGGGMVTVSPVFVASGANTQTTAPSGG